MMDGTLEAVALEPVIKKKKVSKKKGGRGRGRKPSCSARAFHLFFFFSLWDKRENCDKPKIKTEKKLDSMSRPQS
jgi:hypothetical protein